ncbi:MAG: hypothetical protein R3F37_23435 [Candidatus Competibacteraceae bacterium]
MAIQAGDLLALCSDGVWEHITENEFWTATLEHGPAAAAHWLVDTAVQRGGADADNATLVLLRADPEVAVIHNVMMHRAGYAGYRRGLHRCSIATGARRANQLRQQRPLQRAAR